MNNLFFSKQPFATPAWLTKKLSRRHLLKSAAGVSAMASCSRLAFALPDDEKKRYLAALNTKRWATLDAVLNHLLPTSASGPGAQDIQATYYLYQLVHQQPTAQEEIDFIYQGVGWLNGYSDKHMAQAFVQLKDAQKEQVLKGISRSPAGTNWLNMLILNIYEAMLSPPAYGGNPDGIGWRWLEHQAGFPLPKAGQRFYELPPRSKTSAQAHVLKIPSVDLTARHSFIKGKRKA